MAAPGPAQPSGASVTSATSIPAPAIASRIPGPPMQAARVTPSAVMARAIACGAVTISSTSARIPAVARRAAQAARPTTEVLVRNPTLAPASRQAVTNPGAPGSGSPLR
jgi:hypothetical protein